MRAYIANSLFSLADLMFNKYLYDELKKNFPSTDFYLPQLNEGINDKSSYADSEAITDGDDMFLLDSDFMIAVIDNVDEGVATEVGKFHGYHLAHKEHYYLNVDDGSEYDMPPIFALYTDSRQQGRDNKKKIDALVADGTENQFAYKNLYEIGTIKKAKNKSVKYNICSTVEELVEEIRKFIDEREGLDFTLDK